MGKRFDVLDKALETLNKLRKRQSTLPFVDMVFLPIFRIFALKNTADTDLIDEANDFLLCKLKSCLFYIRYHLVVGCG